MHLQLRVALGGSVLPSNISFNFRLTKIEEEIICMKVQSIRVNEIHIGDWGFLHMYGILVVKSRYEYKSPS